ncbi:MAG: 3'-5' exonuclease, partial [Gemmatimonadaceae bacterium]
MTVGTTIRPEVTPLVARALDFLAGGPASSVSLVGHICQMPAPPPAVAEHMARVLLAPYREFSRDGEGHWLLAAARVVSPPSAPIAATAAEPRSELHVPASGQPGRRRISALAGMPFVVVDVETTGSRPWAGDRITEIAAIVVRDGEIVERYETLVNPERAIPPMITAITRINWSMVKDAPRFRDVCRDVLALLDGRIFVAHNADFDWRFVSAEVSRATGMLLDGQRLCTVRLARKLLPQLRSRRLDSVAEHYGVEIPARHRAGGDAIATAHILQRLLDDARGHECECWDDLQRLLGTPGATRRRGRRPPAMPRPVDKDT